MHESSQSKTPPPDEGDRIFAFNLSGDNLERIKRAKQENVDTLLLHKGDTLELFFEKGTVVLKTVQPATPAIDQYASNKALFEVTDIKTTGLVFPGGSALPFTIGSRYLLLGSRLGSSSTVQRSLLPGLKLLIQEESTGENYETEPLQDAQVYRDDQEISPTQLQQELFEDETQLESFRQIQSLWEAVNQAGSRLKKPFLYWTDEHGNSYKIYFASYSAKRSGGKETFSLTSVSKYDPESQQFHEVALRNDSITGFKHYKYRTYEGVEHSDFSYGRTGGKSFYGKNFSNMRGMHNSMLFRDPNPSDSQGDIFESTFVELFPDGSVVNPTELINPVTTKLLDANGETATPETAVTIQFTFQDEDDSQRTEQIPYGAYYDQEAVSLLEIITEHFDEFTSSISRGRYLRELRLQNLPKKDD